MRAPASTARFRSPDRPAAMPRQLRVFSSSSTVRSASRSSDSASAAATGGASRRSFRQRATWLARSVPAATVPWAREEGRPSSTRPSRQGNRRAVKGVGMSGRLSDRGAHIECKSCSMPAQDG